MPISTIKAAQEDNTSIDARSAGTMRISVISSVALIPVSNATVTISYTGDPDAPLAVLNTDSSGQTPEIELASLDLMISLAENGMGIACTPREFVKKQLEEKKLFEIKTNPSLPARAIGLVLPKQETITFAVKEFLKLINQKEI